MKEDDLWIKVEYRFCSKLDTLPSKSPDVDELLQGKSPEQPADVIKSLSVDGPEVISHVVEH